MGLRSPEECFHAEIARYGLRLGNCLYKEDGGVPAPLLPLQTLSLQRHSYKALWRAAQRVWCFLCWGAVTAQPMADGSGLCGGDALSHLGQPMLLLHEVLMITECQQLD